MEILIIILLLLIIALAYSLFRAWNKISEEEVYSKGHDKMIHYLTDRLKNTENIVAENHRNIEKLKSDFSREFPSLSEEEFKKVFNAHIKASEYLKKLNENKKDEE